MSLFDPNTPAGKLAEELQRDHYSKQSPTINIVNNNNNYDMGDNGIVQLGNGTIITNPSPAKKSIYSMIKDSLVNHATKWILGTGFSLLLTAIAYWV